MEKLIYNARILTMNQRMETIEKGYIRIDKGKITEIGRMEELGEREERCAGVAYDLEGMWVMPGFVNTHTHVPMTMLRGYADDLPLHTWLTCLLYTSPSPRDA